MKILVLMKRFGTNKDLVMQNFGRQVRLFEQLQRLGHRIDFLCMDYKKFESRKVRIKSIDYYIEPFSLTKFSYFLKKLRSLLKQNRYDLIVPSTSPILGIVAYFYSRKYKVKMLYELQDSFDVYGEYRIPFVRQLDRHIIKNCEAVVCVSQTLKKRIAKFRKKPVYVIENGIERDLFRPMDKGKCRKKLNLPSDAKIIVYIGHITRLKGFDVLLKAFDRVREKYPDTYLLLSGLVDRGISLEHENVIFRPLPKREQVVMAINSADVAVNPDIKNEFTEFCFPYKIAEYMACKVPIVASDIGDVSILLKRYKGSLCSPNDAEELSRKILEKLRNFKRVDYKNLKRFEWKALGERLDRIISGVS